MRIRHVTRHAFTVVGYTVIPGNAKDGLDVQIARDGPTRHAVVAISKTSTLFVSSACQRVNRPWFRLGLLNSQTKSLSCSLQ